MFINDTYRHNKCVAQQTTARPKCEWMQQHTRNRHKKQLQKKQTRKNKMRKLLFASSRSLPLFSFCVHFLLFLLFFPSMRFVYVRSLNAVWFVFDAIPYSVSQSNGFDSILIVVAVVLLRVWQHWLLIDIVVFSPPKHKKMAAVNPNKEKCNDCRLNSAYKVYNVSTHING